MGRHTLDRRAAAPAPIPPRPARGAHRAEPTTGASVRGAMLTGSRAAVLAAVVAGTGAFAASQGEAGLPAAQALTTGDAVDRNAQAASRAAERAPVERTFSVVVDGVPQDVRTTADTVGDALAAADVVVGPQDRVSVPVTDAVTDGMSVQVDHVVTERVTEDTVTEHGVVEQEDDTLPEGERVVASEGIDGSSSVVYEVARTITGEEISRQVVAEIVGSEPVDEVVRIGTGKIVEEPQAVASALATDATGNRAIGAELAAARGWGGDQFSCLDALWTRESDWRHTADNPTSSAYGIPQALPGSKMASHGADWATNPATQIAWGLDYIAGRYGTPCGALSHSDAVGWY